LEIANTNQSSSTAAKPKQKKQKQNKLNEMFEEKDVLLDESFLQQILGVRPEDGMLMSHSVNCIFF
jgi:hypothetical protein